MGPPIPSGPLQRNGPCFSAAVALTPAALEGVGAGPFHWRDYFEHLWLVLDLAHFWDDRLSGRGRAVAIVLAMTYKLVEQGNDCGHAMIAPS